VFYLKLHAIPEQLAHKHGNTQSQLIMALALLALLKFPDVVTPLNDISSSLSKMTQTGGRPKESGAPQRDDDQRERGEG